MLFYHKNVATLQSRILYMVCEHVNPFKFSDNLSTTQGHYQEVQTVIITDPMPSNYGDSLASRFLKDVL